MKILYIITGLRFGGAERLLLLTCQELIPKGARITIIYFDPYAPMKELFQALNLKLLLMPLNLLTFFKLRSHINRERYDIIHTHLIHADIIGRMAAFTVFPAPATGVFATAHGTEWFRWRRTPYSALIRWLDRKLSQPKRSRVIAISKSVSELLVKGQKIRPDKVTLVYNAVQVPAQMPHRSPVVLPGRILFVGRLAPEKNIPCLLEAMAHLKHLELHLTIVGEGDLKSSLMRQCDESGLNERVHFKDTQTDLTLVYQEHDILVLPSRHEGLGIVMLEAFCQGTLVIGADVDGIREVLTDGRGLLFQNDNAEDLAAKIQSVYQSTANIDERRQNSFEYVKKYHDIKSYSQFIFEQYHGM